MLPPVTLSLLSVDIMCHAADPLLEPFQCSTGTLLLCVRDCEVHGGGGVDNVVFVVLVD